MAQKSLTFGKLKKIASLAQESNQKAPLADLKNLLRRETTSAIACNLAAKQLLGDYLNWEPESIWETLHQDGVDVPEINQSKILAVIALKLVPSFYWDAMTFEKTSLTFNNIIPNPEILQEANPAQLSWSIKEASMILGQEREFSSEPISYTAVVLHRAGFVVAPEGLEFAQEVLDNLNRDTKLKNEVQEAWKSLKDKDLLNHVFEETPLGVQLGRLAGVHLYIEEKKVQCKEDLTTFRE